MSRCTCFEKQTSPNKHIKTKNCICPQHSPGSWERRPSSSKSRGGSTKTAVSGPRFLRRCPRRLLPASLRSGAVLGRKRSTGAGRGASRGEMPRECGRRADTGVEMPRGATYAPIGELRVGILIIIFFSHEKLGAAHVAKVVDPPPPTPRNYENTYLAPVAASASPAPLLSWT
jgi:hypothetical protein